MKYIYSILFILLAWVLVPTALLCQTIKVDSLETVLQRHKEKDTIRVNLLNDIADKIFRKDFDKTMAYLEESLAISDSLGFIIGKGNSIHVKAMTISTHLNFEEGLPYYNEAIKIYKTLDDKRRISNCYYNMGILFYRQSKYKMAIEYYSKSLKLREEIDFKKGVISCLYYIGLANKQRGNLNDAILYYKEALGLSEEINYVKRKSDCLTSIGNVYSHQGNYPLALEYHNKALVIAKEDKNDKNISDALMSIGNVYIRLQQYDKAIEFHEKSLQITKNTGNKNTASILNNLGEVYMSKKDYKKAQEYFEQALEKFTNKVHIGICLNNIANVYLELKDNVTALEYFEKAKILSTEIENRRGLCQTYLGIAKVYFNQQKYSVTLSNVLKSKELSTKLELLDFTRDAQQLLSETYYEMGDYKKALSSYQQFKILNDSLFNKKNIEKITQLESEYKYKQAIDSANIRELKLTKTVKNTSLNLEKSKRNYLWAIIGFLLISILLGGIIFYLKYRNIKSKTENIVIEQKLLRSQMTPHFIFNSLSVLQGMILNNEDKKSVSYLSKFSKLLRIILENSRDKLVLLSQELGAVENYLALQNLENESYLYNISVEKNIDVASVEIPPMLIQPFVENAIEHAFGNMTDDKQIDVHLKYVNKELICTITDNGRGIDSRQEIVPKDKNSLATTITSERLKILSQDYHMKGAITIEDRQKYNKQGTMVTIIIPHKISTS